mmetsp:Transcript_50603/g.90401  ORF Transcript_50603/g.90401 Transcript_50603/m.90401 type:complete len:213 (-) Transcript_50603:88-726(-)
MIVSSYFIGTSVLLPPPPHPVTVWASGGGGGWVVVCVHGSCRAVLNAHNSSQLGDQRPPSQGSSLPAPHRCRPLLPPMRGHGHRGWAVRGGSWGIPRAQCCSVAGTGCPRAGSDAAHHLGVGGLDCDAGADGAGPLGVLHTATLPGSVPTSQSADRRSWGEGLVNSVEPRARVVTGLGCPFPVQGQQLIALVVDLHEGNPQVGPPDRAAVGF